MKLEKKSGSGRSSGWRRARAPRTSFGLWDFIASCIYDWLARFREGGVEALRFKKIPGRKPTLSGDQLKKLYGWVAHENPQQLQFEFALWTRDMVRQLIRREFGVRLSPVSVGRLLRKLGPTACGKSLAALRARLFRPIFVGKPRRFPNRLRFSRLDSAENSLLSPAADFHHRLLSPQKPLRQAYQQDPEAVERWKVEEYPAIRKAAKQAGAVIFFADEASVRSDHHSGTTWAPVGKTPVASKTGAHSSVNLISAISPRGELRFMTIKGKMTAPRFIDFFQRLLSGLSQPIYLIVDRHPVHRSSKVRQSVESSEGQLKLFFLPSYSPQLNPDEHVSNSVKNHGVGRSTPKGPDPLKWVASKQLRSLQKLPMKVRGLSSCSETFYTAA